MALAFGALLEADGRYDAVSTRTSDVTLGNTERAKLCNAFKATILVSVHPNGASNPATDYTAGLYGARRPAGWPSRSRSCSATGRTCRPRG